MLLKIDFKCFEFISEHSIFNILATNCIEIKNLTLNHTLQYGKINYNLECYERKI